jgi:Asp-tRNA(Asn)/Glu-tRNA(Gln) amidotransferase A subunit family amidase
LRLLEAAKSAVARFDDVDVIASLTAMFTPNVLTAEAGPEKVWARNRNLVHNLVSANYLALGAATLPVGLDRLGMAVGLQFIAKGGDDERVATIACAAERGCAVDVQGLALRMTAPGTFRTLRDV